MKASILDGTTPNIFFSDCAIDGEDMVKFLKDKEYDRFPEDMREAAREAYETFLHTRDGQLADIIVDRAALDAIRAAGERSKEEIVRQYAESTVAVADIRIAVRACKTGKSSDFMKKAMAECDTLDKERLIHAAVSGMDQIMSYLAERNTGTELWHWRNRLPLLRDGVTTRSWRLSDLSCTIHFHWDRW